MTTTNSETQASDKGLTMRNKNKLKEIALMFLLGVGIIIGGLIIIMIGIGVYYVQRKDLTEFAQLLLFVFCLGIIIGGIRVMFYTFKEIKPFTEELEEWWGVHKYKNEVQRVSFFKRILYITLGMLFVLIGILGSTLWIIWCLHFNTKAEFVSGGHILGFIIIFVLILIPFEFSGYLSLRAYMRAKRKY